MKKTGKPRKLAAPRPAHVRAGENGVPVAIGSTAVDSVREEWVVEDRWWTPRPLRRRYFELVLADGRNVTVMRELTSGKWFTQRA